MGTSCSRPLLGQRSHYTNTDDKLALPQAEDARNGDSGGGARETVAIVSSGVLGTSSPDPPVSREWSPPGASPSDCGDCWGLPPICSSARVSKGGGGKSPSGSSGGSAIDNDSGDNGERSPHPGGSRCLDAIAIALNQAYGGEGEHWYKSALQLQLVCLALCGACRSVPAWHVRIDDQTPESLWDPNIRISSRVPAVMALRLTWVYGRMNDFVLDAGDRQWKCLEVLRLERFKSRSCPDRPKPRLVFDQEQSSFLSSTVWPPSLRQLEFGDGFTVRIATLECPPSLQQLSIGHWCDERIACPGWPMSLQKISFSGLFDQPITGVVWPTSLRELSFGNLFKQPIVEVVWPSSLQRLSFGRRFDQPITEVAWPASLQHLSFGLCFNEDIAGVVWPASLEQLSFGDWFNRPIAEVVWPTSLQQLSFGLRFNQPITEVVWPASLQELSFGDSFDYPIAEVVWPAALQKLSFGNWFNRPIADVVWPASLRQLSFGKLFNRPIAGVVWPTSLQQLSFGDSFNQPISSVVWPSSLQHLSLGDGFNWPIAGVVKAAVVREMFFPAHRRNGRPFFEG